MMIRNAMEEYSDKVMMMMVRESTDTVSHSNLEYSSALPSKSTTLVEHHQLSSTSIVGSIIIII